MSFKASLSRSLFLAFFLCAEITLANVPTFPRPPLVIPAPPLLAAKSYLLIDYRSDQILAEHHIDDRVEPASLTKMMTVYVLDHALQNNKVQLHDLVKISKKAWEMEGSRMFVEVNSTVPLEALLRGIIIQSGNDASVAIAEHIAGSESLFVEMMNYYAKQLGMNNTHFVNATGLPHPDHYTTTRDMAILAKALIRDFPNTYKIYSQKEFIYNNIKQENRNRLLWNNEFVDGIKTGHTNSAGYCMVASGLKDEMRLIAIVMGTQNESSRMEETNKLLTYGFRFFETRKLYSAHTPLKTSRIWMGKQKEIQLGLAQDLYVTIGHGQYEDLKTIMDIEKTIKAPILQGAGLGKISIQLNNKVIVERPMVSLHDISAGGFLKRTYDRSLLTAHHLLDQVIN